MGSGAGEEHVRSDQMPQPPNPNSDAWDKLVVGKCVLNSADFGLLYAEIVQKPDSDATDEALLGDPSLKSNNETAQNSDSDEMDVDLLDNRGLRLVSFELGLNETVNPDLNPNLDGIGALERDVNGRHWSELCCTMRPAATLFAAEYRREVLKRQLEPDYVAGLDDPLNLADNSLDGLSLMNHIGSGELLKKLNDLNLEGDTESEDRYDEIPLSLVKEFKDLDRLLKERKEWAYQKVQQAATKLMDDLSHLKRLRIKKEKNQLVSQDKPTAEVDPNIKRKLTDMETALMKTNEQVDRAELAVRYLEADNATLRADVQALKLSASESMEMCLKATVREKTHLKKLLSWQEERSKLQEGITVQKQKLLELQEELHQVKASKKAAEAKWREEKKAKEPALAQIAEEKRLMEATKVNKKREYKTLRSKIDLDLRCSQDDLQRLEQELSHAKRFTYPNQHSSNASASGSQNETFAMLHHESDDLDEKEDGIDRECIICSEDEASVLFLPCAHQVLCASCNDGFGKKGIPKCPTCRDPIEQRVCVFGVSS